MKRTSDENCSPFPSDNCFNSFQFSMTSASKLNTVDMLTTNLRIKISHTNIQLSTVNFYLSEDPQETDSLLNNKIFVSFKVERMRRNIFLEKTLLPLKIVNS